MNKNNSYFSQKSAKGKKQINPKNSTLFIFLIVLLFYFVPLLASAAGADPARFSDYLYLYTTISYTVIVLSIIIFQKEDLNVFQDHFSLWTVVLGCFLAAIQGGQQELIYRIFLVLLGLRLSFYILVDKAKIKIPSLKSLLTGVLWAFITVLIIALLLFFLNPIHEALPPNLSTYFLQTFLYQISFVTVIEEACFRGLLYGFLMINGYQEDRALVIQGLLFWGVHYLKMSANPVLFFIGIPLLTISTSLIIKKYKMLYLSVVVHTLANVLGPALLAII